MRGVRGKDANKSGIIEKYICSSFLRSKLGLNQIGSLGNIITGNVAQLRAQEASVRAQESGLNALEAWLKAPKAWLDGYGQTYVIYSQVDKLPFLR